jgi:hypothetical protein
MAWRHLIRDVIHLADEEITDRVIQRVKCVQLPGTGLDELWDLASEHNDWDVLQSVLKAAGSAVPEAVITFVTKALPSRPEDAWNLALTNVFLLNKIPEAGRLLSSYLNDTSVAIQTKYNLFETLSYALPSQSIALCPNLLSTLVLFALQMLAYESSDEAVCLYCLHNLLLSCQDTYLPHIDSPLLRIFDVLATLKASHCIQLSPTLLNSLLDVRRSPSLTLIVAEKTYILLLKASYCFPEMTIDSLGQLDPVFSLMPFEALVERVKGREPGYENSLAVLTAAASVNLYWSCEVVQALKASDILALRTGPTMGSFLASHGHKIPNLVSDCVTRYLEQDDKGALAVLQYLSYKHVDAPEVFLKCVESMDNDAVVMLTGKFVRVFGDGEDTSGRAAYSRLIVKLTKRACTHRHVSVLQVVLRGLRMIDTGGHESYQVHAQCMELIVLLVRCYPDMARRLGGCLRHYATKHPRKYLTLLIKPLDEHQNVEALTWLYPRFRSRSAVAVEIERRIVSSLLLDYRQRQNPYLLHQLVDYTFVHGYENFTNAVKVSLFKTMLVTITPALRRLTTVKAAGMPFQVRTTLTMMERVAPPIRCLDEATVEQVLQEALALCAWFPWTATRLLWMIRERVPAWAHPFLCSVLDQGEDDYIPDSDIVDHAVEVYFWSCYHRKEDPIPNTVGSQLPEVRESARRMLTALPPRIVSFVKEHLHRSIVEMTIPPRYVRRVYARMCKAVPQSLFTELQRQAVTVCGHCQEDVLLLLLDLLVNVPRSVTPAYAGHLAWWSLHLMEDGKVHDEEGQMVLTDVLVFCIELLYKIDCKRSFYLVESFQKACKLDSVKRSRRLTLGTSKNRLDTLVPELKERVAEFLKLPYVI